MSLSKSIRSALLLILLAACSASQAELERGQQLASEGDWDAAVDYFERALGEDPDNVEYRIALHRATLEAQQHHLMLARRHLAEGELESAVAELERALEYGPHPYAEDQLRELRQDDVADVEQAPTLLRLRAAQPLLDPASKKLLSLQFAEGTSLRRILETLAQLAGVNILFDEAFRDRPVSIDLKDVTFQEALDVLTRTNGLFYKVIGPSTVTLSPERSP